MNSSVVLTLLWSAGHIYPTYKESFQVRWDTVIPADLNGLFVSGTYLIYVPLVTKGLTLPVCI